MGCETTPRFRVKSAYPIVFNLDFANEQQAQRVSRDHKQLTVEVSSSMSCELMSLNTVSLGDDRVLFIVVNIASVCNESTSRQFNFAFFSLKPIYSQNFHPLTSDKVDSLI